MRKTVCCFFICFFLMAGAAVWGQADTRSPMDDALAAMDRAFNTQPLLLEDEYYLGRAVAANIFSVYRPYNGNPSLTRYLNRICQTIVINSPQPIIFSGYHVVILDTGEYNAFASPGGHIMITRGLLEAASSEDALAALIAHELAHIILRHAASIIEQMSLANEMSALASRAAAMSGNSQATQKALEMRTFAAVIMDTMMKNGYSQTQEFNADIKALELLAASGYDPQGLVEMLQILQRLQPGRAGGFNSTHPSPAERLVNVNTSIRRYQVPNTRSARVQRFENR